MIVMVRMDRWRACCVTCALILAALSVTCRPAAAQNAPAQADKPRVAIAGTFDKVRVLPPVGPAPRLADGHPDLTGRWYPNSAGRMLQFAYSVDPKALTQFASGEPPEALPAFKAGTEKY